MQAAAAAANVLQHGVDSFTSFLLTGNGSNASTTLTDRAIVPNTITAFGDAQLSNTHSTLGFGTSLKLDGTGDYCTWPSSTGCDLSGDFTIDGWFWFNSLAGTNFALYLNLNQTTTFGAQVLFQNGSTFTFHSSSANASWDIANGVAFDASPSTGVWAHYAVTRSGNNYTTFKNGAVVNTFSNSSTPMTTTNADVIGCVINSGTPSLFFNGWIQQLRISKGIVRWSGAFTPPTAPYTY